MRLDRHGDPALAAVPFRTVDHLSNVYRKLEVGGRTQLALRLGATG